MFRNAIFYRIPRNWTVTEEQLSRRPLIPPGSQDAMSRGWIPPAPHSEQLVYQVGRRYLIALGIEQRLLPASVVRQEADRRAEEIAAQQGYRPGRAQMKELREAVLKELMPRAFIRRSRIPAWIDPVNGLLVVDAASQGKAEDLLEHLRYTLDSFPLALLRTERSPVSAMAGWLAGDAPDGFTIDQDAELHSVANDRTAVRYSSHALDGEDVRAHLAAGKLPTKLALTFDDRVSFVLTERTEIKRLDFLEVLKEQQDKQETNAQVLFDSAFELETAEQIKLIDALVEALGGELQVDE